MANNPIEPAKILQINLQRSKSATIQLQSFVKNQNIDVILAQELYIINGKPLFLPNSWQVHYKFDPDHPARTAIIITRSDWHPISYLTERDYTIIKLDFNSYSSFFASIYSSPAENIKDPLDNIQSFLTQYHNSSVIIGGDFNAHSPNWQYSTYDLRGHDMEDFIATNNLIIHNEPNSPPTFKTGTAQGWPDLTLTTQQFATSIDNWQVSDELSCSDHLYITFEIQQDTKINVTQRYNTNYNQTKFINKIKNKAATIIHDINNANTKSEIEEVANNLIVDIKRICSETFKLKTQIKNNNLNWWTKDLTILKNKTKALRRRLKTSIATEEKTKYLILFKKSLAEYKKSIIKAKIESWRKYCSSTTNPYSILQKIATGKIFKQTTLTALHGINPHDAKSILEDITSTIFPKDNPEDDEPSHQTIRSQHRNYFSQTNETPITSHEISLAIKSLNPKKAPGPDGISNTIVKLIHYSNPSIIHNLFNKLLTLGCFPKCFKEGQVILFHKPNKDPRNASSYRPIALLPSLGKVFEKIIMDRLSHHIYISNPISNNQHGFKKLSSTEHALDKVMTTIQDNKNKDLYTILISLDLQGAFDSMWWPGLLTSIKETNCSQQIYNIFSDFFTDRKISIQHDNYTLEKTMDRGCSQGSRSGPFLWNLFFDKIIKLTWPSHTTIVAYADDAILITKGRTKDELQTHANASVDIFAKACKEHKLIISSTKTQALIIRKKTHTLRANPKITINGCSIRHVKEMKFLGVIIDKKLSFLPHIQNIRIKANKIANNLRKMAGHFWGLRTHILKIIYKTIVEKIVGYAASIWIHPLTARKQRQLLSIQRHFSLLITRSFSTLSTDAANILAGLPPIHLALTSFANNTTVTMLRKSLTIGDTTINPSDLDLKINTLNINPSHYGSGVLTKNQDTKTNSSPQQANVYEYYTDGSKIENQVGSAFCLFKNNLIIHTWQTKLRSTNSVFQAEVTAIHQALLHAKSLKIRQFTIYTDSLSSIHSIKNPLHHSQLIQDILTTLHRQKHKWKCSIQWVKAHNSNRGNDYADALAKGAATDDSIPSTLVHLPISYLKSLNYTNLLKTWQYEWDNSETGRSTYQILPKVDPNLTFGKPYINYFITEHGPFPKYFKKTGKSNTDLCICGEVGSATHYIFACPLTTKWHIRKPTNATTEQHLKFCISQASLTNNFQQIGEFLMRNGLDLCQTVP